jgi:Peptidase inhibitor family I36
LLATLCLIGVSPSRASAATPCPDLAICFYDGPNGTASRLYVDYHGGSRPTDIPWAGSWNDRVDSIVNNSRNYKAVWHPHINYQGQGRSVNPRNGVAQNLQYTNVLSSVRFYWYA